MNHCLKTPLIAAMTVSLAASGCALDAGGDLDEIDMVPSDALTDEGLGIITGNGAPVLTPEIVTLYTPLAKILAALPLTVNSLNGSEILASLDGDTFLRYMVKCALPEGQSLMVNTPGGPIELQGKVGIAPEWRDGPLSVSGQRWLTACLLAHVNAAGANVPILLRGNHPVLSAGAQATSEYTLREGAFYGNIFGVLPSMYACAGSGQKAECGASTNPALALRRCAASSLLGLSQCGFSVPGNCYDLSGPDACESLSDGEYRSCHSNKPLLLLPSTEYAETITVYLKNEGDSSSYAAACN